MRGVQRPRGLLALALAIAQTGACSAPLKTSVAPLQMPATYPSSVQWEGLELAIDPIDTPSKSQPIFGTDMWEATVLPPPPHCPQCRHP